MPDAQLLSKAITEPNAASGLTLAVKIVQKVAGNPAEPKYRRVNLGGNAGAKLVAVPTLVAFLKSAGWIETPDGHLELPADVAPEGLELLQQASAALPTAAAPSAAAVADPTVGMSLKQKAVYMAEQKAIAEKESAKRFKAEQLAKLEQDKMIREKDENWKSAAAGVKGGKDINTFRGKYGEDQGGG